MSGNPIGVVICRVGAILLAVSAAQSLGFVIVPLLNSPPELGNFFLISALMVLAPLVSDELVAIGTYLIGIYVLVFGIVSLSQTEALRFAQSSVFGDYEKVTDGIAAHAIASRVSYAVQIALGLVLIFRGKKGPRH